MTVQTGQLIILTADTTAVATGTHVKAVS